jgi:hypothetical protein
VVDLDVLKHSIPLEILNFLEKFSLISFGGFYISSAIETTIDTQSEFEKVAGTTTSLGNEKDFVVTNGRLQYVGDDSRLFIVMAVVGTTTDAPNQNIAWRFAIDGTTLAESEIVRRQAAAADIGALSVICAFRMDPESFLEMYVTNTSSDGNVTATNMSLLAVGFEV